MILWPNDEEYERWQEGYHELQAEVGEGKGLLDFTSLRKARAELEGWGERLIGSYRTSRLLSLDSAPPIRSS